MQKYSVIVILLLFFCFSFDGTAKKQKINSEQTSLNERVKTLLDLSGKTYESNPDEAIKYSLKALELSVSENDLKIACQCLNQLAEIYNYIQDYKNERDCYIKGMEYSKSLQDNQEYYQFLLSIGQLEKDNGNYQLSIEYYLDAKRIIENLQDKSYLPVLLNNIGISYFKLSRYEEALKYYFDALSYNENKPNSESATRTLINIGSVYIELRNFEKALIYFQQSLQATEGQNLKNLRSVIFNNIGNIYLGLNKYENAIDNHQKALKIKFELKDLAGIGSSYNNIGTAYEALGKYNEANDYYEKALNQYRKLDHMPGIATSLRNLGNITIKLGNLTMADKYLSEALAIADSNNLLYVKAEIFYSYAIFYSSQGNHKESDFYYSKHVNLNDSLNNASYRERIAQMEVLYDTEKKDRENQLLKLENERKENSIKQQQTLLLYLGIFLFLALSITLLVYLLYKSRKKTTEILAEKNRILTESEENLRLINATKDKFFSIISHDLRNPFATLSLKVYNIKNNLSKRNYDKVDSLVKTLDKNVDLTKSLLNNLLDWSTSQLGKMNFEPTKMNLTLEADSIVKLLKEQAEVKEQKINISLEDNLEVFADKNMITTVIRNLMTNAMKFTPRFGLITLVASRKNNHIEVSVIDSGVGIPDNKLDKLFNIDNELKAKGTENEAGTGLGLILCKEFIDKHNGSIYATSEINKGSKFTFTIPAI
jgi:signal transduction histidine kinase/Tfp pilus assembly protein PilF